MIVQTRVVALQFGSVAGMLKLIVSAPAVAFAWAIAARKVHCSPALVASASQMLSARFVSAASPVVLTLKMAAEAAAPVAKITAARHG